MTMKKFLLIFTVLAFSFSIAAAQGSFGYKSKHKLPVGNGIGGLNAVDTGRPNYELISGGSTADPSWKLVAGYFRLPKDTLITSTTGIYTDLQFNAADTQSNYWFDIKGFDTSSSNGGLKFLDSIPTGATIKAQVQGQSTGITAQTADIITANATPTIAFATATSTNNGWFRVSGVIHIGSTAGKCMFGAAKGTSGTCGILANSSISYGKY